jgi:hypothetical protein
MPYNFINGDVLRIVFYGRLNFADFSAALSDLARAEDSQPQARDQLIDLTAVTQDDLTGADIEQTVYQCRHRLQNPVRSAFAAPRLVDYGMARMFQIRNDQSDIHFAVFHTLAEAEAWLASDGKDFDR